MDFQIDGVSVTDVNVDGVPANEVHLNGTLVWTRSTHRWEIGSDVTSLGYSLALGYGGLDPVEIDTIPYASDAETLNVSIATGAVSMTGSLSVTGSTVYTLTIEGYATAVTMNKSGASSWVSSVNDIALVNYLQTRLGDTLSLDIVGNQVVEPKTLDVVAYYESNDYDRATAQSQGFLWFGTPLELKYKGKRYQGESGEVPPLASNVADLDLHVASEDDWSLFEVSVETTPIDVFFDEGNATQTDISTMVRSTWYEMTSLSASLFIGLHASVNTDTFSSDRTGARFTATFNIREKATGNIKYKITSLIEAEGYSES